MNITKLTDEEILAEIARIRYLYGLKKEIRYGLMREEAYETESVAEHIYGMQVLARYFLPIEDTAHTWNHSRVYEMILWHDLDELETGDIIGFRKTDADRRRGKNALTTALSKMPAVIREGVTVCIAEYDAQQTAESRFVKAIDSVEASVQLFSEDGKRIQRKNRTTFDEHTRIKDPFLAEFPAIKRFSDLINAEMVRGGFFAESPVIQ